MPIARSDGAGELGEIVGGADQCECSRLRTRGTKCLLNIPLFAARSTGNG
jgi:hypothetical protein